MPVQDNSRPAAKPAPLIRRHEDDRRDRRFLMWIPAFLVSGIFHAALFAVFFFLVSNRAPADVTESAPPVSNEANVQSEPPPEPQATDPLTITDIDPAAIEPDLDIQYNVDRKADVSVPGMVDPNAPVGILNGDKTAPPMNLPAPGGLGGTGQGGALEVPGLTGTSDLPGMAGGYYAKGAQLPGTFYGRSGATREKRLIEGGGTKASEAAVAEGLNWLIRVQSPDGRWMMDGNFKDKGQPNDIAGTAFGLLPFLGAGKTHKASKDNPWDKPIERALLFLIRKQDKKTGNFGGGMYAHALATIAMSEAYGLTQDPVLRRPAQMAVNYLLAAQHSEGGWRYSPGQPGDTSVTGWAVMALKSARMASLDVPEVAFKKAINYFNNCCNEATEGYGYVGKGGSATMSAVGLLCRQYLQSWGPNNLRMIKGIQNNIKPLPPGATRNMYYYYYATQVMHHFGGDEWKAWNEKMREDLIRRQDKVDVPGYGPLKGSWSPVGDPHGRVGGRLMETSLCLLTLEVYYRYLPLYYREAGERQQKLLSGN